MSFVLGMDAALWYQEDGYLGSAGWKELDNSRDVTLNLETSEADVTTRANQGWRATAAALKDATIEFEMVWDTNDQGFNAIRSAFFGATPEDKTLGIRCLDGGGAADPTENDGQGLEADMTVTTFSRAEPLEEALMVSVTLKVTYSINAPRWIENGTPV